MDEQKNTVLNHGRYLVKLLACALTKQQAPEKPEDLQWETLFRLAKSHGIETMAYDSIEKLSARPGETLWNQWKNSRQANIAKNMVQRTERDAILNALEERGVDAMPLKGSLLIEMYPSPEQRQMSDLDILIRNDQREQVSQILPELGYEVERYEITNEDTYSKKPFMHVEMHHALFPKTLRYENLKKYYADPWKFAFPEEGHPHRYRMSWEDYYIYLLAHLYKHFSGGGSGIRNVMDIHVFLSQYGTQLNQQYVQEELEKMEISEFRDQMETLARQWFGKEEVVKPVPEDVESTIFTSGAYGIRENSRRHNLDRMEERFSNPIVARTAYVLTLLFPNYDRLIVKYPQFKGKKKLLPLLWIYHIGYKILRDRERITGNIKVLREDRKNTTNGGARG